MIVVKRRYPNVLTDDHFEYTLEFDRECFCRITKVSRNSRIASTMFAHFHGGRWASADGHVGPALAVCIDFYYKKWELEHDCAFLGVETPEAKRQRVAEEVKSLIRQELELDKQHQTDSFARWRHK
jgi:hypothetical protein